MSSSFQRTLSAHCLSRPVKPVTNRLLGLFAESFDIRLAIRVKKLLARLFPCRLEFGRCNVPVRSGLLENGTKIHAKLFNGRTTEEPVAVVDLVDNKTWLEDNHMRNHGIVNRIGVLGDVQILLYDPSRVGEECPVSSDSGAILIGLGNGICADRD